MKVSKLSFLLSSESTFDAVKGSANRAKYKMKVSKLSFLLSSESTFDAVKGSANRAKYQIYLGISERKIFYTPFNQ